MSAPDSESPTDDVSAIFAEYAMRTDEEIEAIRELVATWSSIATQNAIEIGRLQARIKRLQSAIDAAGALVDAEILKLEIED